MVLGDFVGKADGKALLQMRASLDKLSLRPIHMTHDTMGLRERLRLRVARSQFEALLGDPPGSVMVGRHRSHVKPSNQGEHLLS